jgi:hypothetical protein
MQTIRKFKTTGKVVIADPIAGYSFILKVQDGEYNCYVAKEGYMVKELRAYHKSNKAFNEFASFTLLEDELCVDAGMGGIFDHDEFMLKASK